MNRKSRALVRFGALLSGAAVASSSVEIARRYRRDIRRARARVSAGSRIAITSSGPIEYAILGEGAPVLVVHGAGGGFDQGLDIGRVLANRGFRVIAPSRFGYLRTPLPSDASAEAQADAHAALLDALDIRRAAVLGVSAGAPSSVQLALRHPDRLDALALGVPGLYAPRDGEQRSSRIPEGTRWLFDAALRSDFLFWGAIRTARPTMIRAILGTPPEVVRTASASERARVDEMLEHILPVTPRRLGLENDAVVIPGLEPYPLERIETPTLIEITQGLTAASRLITSGHESLQEGDRIEAQGEDALYGTREPQHSNPLNDGFRQRRRLQEKQEPRHGFD